MAIILPALSFMLLWYLMSLVPAMCQGRDWRHAFLLACVVWGCLLVLITELLSSMTALSVKGVGLAWAAVACGLVLAAVLMNRRGRRPISKSVELNRSEMLIVLGIFVIGLFLLLTALWVPPLNYDSMTYHLPRVEHWIQNRNVANYPTNNLRQLYLAPFSEYALLHSVLLSGGDYWENGIQFLAWCFTVIGISALTKELGGRRRAQSLAALIAATIPMGMLEAATTQTDLLVSFWLVCTFYFGAIAIRQKDSFAVPAMGLSLGLALLSKTTAYLCALPLLVWFAWASWKMNPRRAARNMGLVLSLALLPNLAFMVRNQELFGNPIGPGDFMGSNRAISPKLVASTLIRDTAMELATPFPVINDWLEKVVDDIHMRILRMDPNDTGVTYPGTRFRVANDYLSEDVAGNPLHSALIIAAIALWIARRRDDSTRVLGAYLAVLGAGIILFCMILMWQPWVTRLQLPWLVLFAAFEGVVFAEMTLKPVPGVMAMILVIASLPYLLFAKSVPLVSAVPSASISRESAVFARQKGLEASYTGAVQEILNSGCARVGLILGGDTWEYPLWSLTRDHRKSHNLRFYSIMTTTPSPFPPSVNERLPPLCLLVSSFTEMQTIDLNGVTYVRSWASPALLILRSR